MPALPSLLGGGGGYIVRTMNENTFVDYLPKVMHICLLELANVMLYDHKCLVWQFMLHTEPQPDNACYTQSLILTIHVTHRASTW